MSDAFKWPQQTLTATPHILPMRKLFEVTSVISTKVYIYFIAYTAYTEAHKKNGEVPMFLGTSVVSVRMRGKSWIPLKH